jgi:hypothetical protein
MESDQFEMSQEKGIGPSSSSVVQPGFRLRPRRFIADEWETEAE